MNPAVRLLLAVGLAASFVFSQYHNHRNIAITPNRPPLHLLIRC